jgi:hypothetical protein
MLLSQSSAVGMRQTPLSWVAAKRSFWSRLASLNYSRLLPSAFISRSQPVRLPNTNIYVKQKTVFKTVFCFT